MQKNHQSILGQQIRQSGGTGLNITHFAPREEARFTAALERYKNATTPQPVKTPSGEMGYSVQELSVEEAQQIKSDIERYQNFIGKAKGMYDKGDFDAVNADIETLKTAADDYIKALQGVELSVDEARKEKVFGEKEYEETVDEDSFIDRLLTGGNEQGIEIAKKFRDENQDEYYSTLAARLYYTPAEENKKAKKLLQNSDAFDVMEPNEKDLFYKIYKVYGKKEAEGFLDYVDERFGNIRTAAAEMEEAAKWAKENPEAASLKVPLGQVASVIGLYESIKWLFTGEPIDEYSPAFKFSRKAAAASAVVKEYYDKNLFEGAGWIWENVINTTLQFGLTMGAAKILSLPATAAARAGSAASQKIVSDITLGLMGSQASANALLDAKQRGLSDSEAISYAFIIGGIEASTEKIGIDALFGNPKSVFTKIFKNSFLRAGMAEGTEEVVANWGNRLTELFYYADEAQLRALYQSFRDKGLNEEEALAETIWSLVKEDAETFVAGMGSGMLINSGFAAVSKVQEVMSSNKVGAQVVKNGQENALIDTALKLNGNTKAHQLASQISNEGVKNKAQMGRLAMETELELGKQQAAAYNNTIYRRAMELSSDTKVAKTIADNFTALVFGNSEQYVFKITDSVEVKNFAAQIAEEIQSGVEWTDELAKSRDYFSQQRAIVEQAVSNKDTSNKAEQIQKPENILATPEGDETVDERELGFTEPNEREIRRPLTYEEQIDEVSGRKKTVQMRHILDLAKKLDSKLKVVFVPNNDGRLSGQKGMFDRDSNTMYLANDISTVEGYAEVFKHEFVHRLELKKAYEGLKRYLFNKSVAFEEYAISRLQLHDGKIRDNRDDAINDLVQMYIDNFKNNKAIPQRIRDNFTREKAEKEAVADFIARTLFKGNTAQLRVALKTDTAALQAVETDLKLFEELARDDRGLFRKVIDAIKDFIASIKGIPQFRQLEEDLNYIEQRLSRVYNSADINKTATDGGVVYENAEFFADDLSKETTSVKEQIKDAQDVLNKMDVVYSGQVPEYVGTKKTAANWVVEQLKKFGFQADRQGFGKIVFSEDEIRSAMKYLDDNEEKVAFVALYYVLKRGIQVGNHGNHKLRQKSTVTFAAPIELNGVRGNMAVVVNLNGNKYYVHRIVMPDGSAFRFNKKDAKQELYQGVPKRSLADTTSFASDTSISYNDKNVKQKQLEIINETNPAPNSYNTWVRSVDDIKTLSETLDDSDWQDEEINPDLTRTDIQNAIENGKITVYSSYPIENGVFVSPSRMEAESYSGNGKVYQKEIDIKDVAWIDPTQGQYAKVENSDNTNLVFSSDDLTATHRDLSTLNKSYMDAVNRGDTEAEKRMVEEAANKAGYTQKLYHGTDQFGFTKFEGTEGFSYDEIQFFTTDSLETAGTYTTLNEVRRISGKQGAEIEQRITNTANDMASFMSSKMGSENYINSEAIIEASEKGWQEVSKLSNKWLRDLYESKYAEERKNRFQKRYKNFETFESSEKAIELKKAVTKYRQQLQLALENKTGGIYEFFANTDNMFVIDGKGAMWNQLKDSRLPENREYNTREVCLWAKEQGYSGVQFKNIIDSGVKQSIAPANVFAFFNPRAQVKSADPVTYDDNGDVIPLTERFNAENEDLRYSSDDLTATHRNLLDRYEQGEITKDEYLAEMDGLYGQAVEQYGAIEKGEYNETDIPVPQAVAEDKPTERFARTFVGAAKLTPEMVNEFEKDVLLGKFTYKMVSDESAMKVAENTVKSNEGEKAWENLLDNGGFPTKNDIAIGEKLLTDAIAKGDTYNTLKYASELADIFTRAGQVVQAARMLGKMTGAGRLVGAQRFIDSVNKDRQKKYGANVRKIKIDPKLAELLATAEGRRAIEQAYGEIMKDAAAQVEPTFLDKWNTWRYFAMLCNPRTHVRNIIGNAIFLPAVRMKDVIGTGLERAFHVDGTKVVKVKKEYRDFAKRDVQTAAAKNFLKGQKYDDKSTFEQNRRTYKSNFLESLTGGVFYALEAEDMFSKNKHYVHALGSYLQAKKIDLNNVSDEVLTKAREYARNEAFKATFNDFNSIANKVSKLSKDHKVLGAFIEGILPFKRTPLNIIRRSVEYSPIGLATSLTKGLYDLKKGKITADQLIDGVASGATGLIVFAIGCLFGALGWAGGTDDDEDKSWYERMLGGQDYAIKIGNHSYTVDWAAPSSIPFFIGVELAEAFEDGFSLNALWDSFGNALEPIINLSALSGVQETIESVRYAQGNEILTSALTDAATNYLLQSIPSPLGALGRTIDEKQRTWYVDKNSAVPEGVQEFANNLKTKIPGLSYTMPEKIDAWGREVSRGGTGERIAENSFSPGYYSYESYTDVDRELERLYEKTKEAKVLPKTAPKYFSVDGKRKDLTADEYVTFAKAKGQYSFEYVEEFINHSEYDKLTDEQKAAVISNLYEYAGAKAKTTVSSYDLMKTYKVVTLRERNGGSAVDYYIKNQKKK